MDKKRKFLEKYIKIKIIQLRDLLHSSRTLGYELPDSRYKGTKGDKSSTEKNKVFSIQEDGEEESEGEEQNESEEEECVFVFKDNNKVKSSLNKKNCPLKCKQAKHYNGSLYFCPEFRNKTLEERKSLQKKMHGLH